jgi:hypothetical protein
VLVDERHIVVCGCRDYADVPVIEVSVDVAPLEGDSLQHQ